MLKTLVAGVFLCALGFFFLNQWMGERALETQAAEDYGLSGIAMDLHRECVTTLSGQRLKSDIVYKEAATRQHHCACIAARSSDRLSDIEQRFFLLASKQKRDRDLVSVEEAEELLATMRRKNIKRESVVEKIDQTFEYCRKELVVAR